MSVYKSGKSPYYQYDFVLNGNRFHGSTKATTKKAAETVERELRAKAATEIEQSIANANGPLTIDIAAGRYFNEVGIDHACSDDTFRALERLVKFFGKSKRLDDITDADVSKLVAWRRKQQRWGRSAYKKRKGEAKARTMATVSNATVNRDTTAVLKKIFMRAKKVWKYSFPKEPSWADHVLKEARERVRELHEGEGDALDAAVRDDYAPWLEFARLTGLRRHETLIKWSEVNWFARQIVTVGKGGKTISTPITSEVKALLEPLRGDHPEWVFTYIAKRTANGKIRGTRYPITYSGSKSEWQRLRERSGVQDFRFHDIRHDVATKTLRETGNLRLVQKVLNHADLKVTARYAHVLDDEVSAALDRVAKSRKKSRNNDRDTG